MESVFRGLRCFLKGDLGFYDGRLFFSLKNGHLVGVFACSEFSGPIRDDRGVGVKSP